MRAYREKAPTYRIPELPVQESMWLSFEYTSTTGEAPTAEQCRTAMSNGVVIPYDLVIQALEIYGFRAQPGRKYRIGARLLVNVEKREVYAIHDAEVEPVWTDEQHAAMAVVKALIEEDRFGEWLDDAGLYSTVWDMFQPIEVVLPNTTGPTYATTYEIVIEAVEDRVETMRTIRKLTDWHLREVKESMDHLPITVGIDLDRKVAPKWVRALEMAGCTVLAVEHEIPISIQGRALFRGWYPTL